MNIFISWSGDYSKSVAELLKEWIKCVIQATNPWISTNIDRGALWFSEINDRLKETTVGIVCLTQENKSNPWLLFEAGALAKGIDANRVCTFLIDLQPTEVENPLAQFNATIPTKDSMWKLIQTLNKQIRTNNLQDRILETVFNSHWNQFEIGFENISKAFYSLKKPEPRSDKSLLLEILQNTRSIGNKLSSDCLQSY